MQVHNLSSREIANFLEISPQSCSTLASGSDKRQPRWTLIFRLLEALGLVLVMKPESIELQHIIEDTDERQEYLTNYREKIINKMLTQ